MSMHRTQLTILELEGLQKHRFPIGKPSQISDAFRLGIRWAKQQEITLPVPTTQPELVAQAKAKSNTQLGAADAIRIYAGWLCGMGAEAVNVQIGRKLLGIGRGMHSKALTLQAIGLINYDRVITNDPRGPWQPTTEVPYE